jgi:Ras association domain-containing protein 7/8
MELKVWVEGIQRVVCGVTDATTCQDVVIALAHATGKTGRFTLIEKWRENERLLSPSERPLRVLHKWGEYASDVHFILRHSDRERKGGDRASKRTEKYMHNFPPLHPEVRPHSSASIRKSLTFSGAHSFPFASKHQRRIAQDSSLESLDEHSSFTSHSSKSSASPYASLEKKRKPGSMIQSGSPYGSIEKRKSPNLKPSMYGNSPRSSSGNITPTSSLDRKARRISPSIGPRTVAPSHMVAPLRNSQAPNMMPNMSSISDQTPPLTPQESNTPIAPWATSSPKIEVEEYDLDKNMSVSMNRVSPISSELNDLPKVNGTFQEKEFREKVAMQGDTEDLIKLVKLQQEKLGVQDSQLKILESEISYWEQREKDYEKQASEIASDIENIQQTDSEMEQEILDLELVCWPDQLDIEKQQEKMLQSELTLMRSKMSNAESELLQNKNKEHNVNTDIENGQQEKQLQQKEQKEEEFRILQEISELQKQINQKLVRHESNQGALDKIINEVKSLESDILEKKTQIANFEKELLESNMECFLTTPTPPIGTSEEHMFTRLSVSRPGSVRKMTHSPQLLKDSVPTAKNPHGMWV